jgi:hypothetical protein
MYVVFNLWDADELGDGTSKGKQLTAYLETEEEGTDTSKCVSVPLSEDDYRAMVDEPETDDEWHYQYSPKHSDLATLFILRLVEEKGN